MNKIEDISVINGNVVAACSGDILIGSTVYSVSNAAIGVLTGISGGPNYSNNYSISGNTTYNYVENHIFEEMFSILHPNYSIELIHEIKNIVEDHYLTKEEKSNKINLLILEKS